MLARIESFNDDKRSKWIYLVRAFGIIAKAEVKKQNFEAASKTRERIREILDKAKERVERTDVHYSYTARLLDTLKLPSLLLEAADAIA